MNPARQRKEFQNHRDFSASRQYLRHLNANGNGCFQWIQRFPQYTYNNNIFFWLMTLAEESCLCAHNNWMGFQLYAARLEHDANFSFSIRSLDLKSVLMKWNLQLIWMYRADWYTQWALIMLAAWRCRLETAHFHWRIFADSLCSFRFRDRLAYIT